MGREAASQHQCDPRIWSGELMNGQNVNYLICPLPPSGAASLARCTTAPNHRDQAAPTYIIGFGLPPKAILETKEIFLLEHASAPRAKERAKAARSRWAPTPGKTGEIERLELNRWEVEETVGTASVPARTAGTGCSATISNNKAPRDIEIHAALFLFSVTRLRSSPDRLRLTEAHGMSSDGIMEVRQEISQMPPSSDFLQGGQWR